MPSSSIAALPSIAAIQAGCTAIRNPPLSECCAFGRRAGVTRDLVDADRPSGADFGTGYGRGPGPSVVDSSHIHSRPV